MLDTTYDVACRFHIEFGANKSKVLVMGKRTNTPSFNLGPMKLECVNHYKYLGQEKNYKNNLDDIIKGIKSKREAAYQTLINIMHNKYFNEIQMETAWKLYTTCTLPIITYASEIWAPTRK